MLFYNFTTVQLVIGVAADLGRPRGQLTASLAKLIPYFNCLFTLCEFCGKDKRT